MSTITLVYQAQQAVLNSKPKNLQDLHAIIRKTFKLPDISILQLENAETKEIVDSVQALPSRIRVTVGMKFLFLKFFSKAKRNMCPSRRHQKF